jgi:hypothetical protein
MERHCDAMVLEVPSRNQECYLNSPFSEFWREMTRLIQDDPPGRFIEISRVNKQKKYIDILGVSSYFEDSSSSSTVNPKHEVASHIYHGHKLRVSFEPGQLWPCVDRHQEFGSQRTRGLLSLLRLERCPGFRCSTRVLLLSCPSRDLVEIQTWFLVHKKILQLAEKQEHENPKEKTVHDDRLRVLDRRSVSREEPARAATTQKQLLLVACCRPQHGESNGSVSQHWIISWSTAG